MSITGVPSIRSTFASARTRSSRMPSNRTTDMERGFGRAGERREKTPFSGRSQETFRATAFRTLRSASWSQQIRIRCEFSSTPESAPAYAEKISISASTPWTGISLRERMLECTSPIGESSMWCIQSRWGYAPPCALHPGRDLFSMSSSRSRTGTGSRRRLRRRAGCQEPSRRRWSRLQISRAISGALSPAPARARGTRALPR